MEETKAIEQEQTMAAPAPTEVEVRKEEDEQTAQQIQKMMQDRFIETQFASMLLAFAISMGIGPEQFGRIIQGFINEPNKVIRAFKNRYRNLDKSFREDDEQQEEQKKSILILPEGVENDRREDNSDRGNESSESAEPTPAPIQ